MYVLTSPFAALLPTPASSHPLLFSPATCFLLFCFFLFVFVDYHVLVRGHVAPGRRWVLLNLLIGFKNDETGKRQIWPFRLLTGPRGSGKR